MLTIGAITGAPVRFFPGAERPGLAEGLEAAIAAHEIFGLPVRAAFYVNWVQRFDAPSGVNRVVAFGDNDASSAGQNAAYGGAARLTAKGTAAGVQLPEQPGCNVLDVCCGLGDEAERDSNGGKKRSGHRRSEPLQEGEQRLGCYRFPMRFR
ncbi:MAG: toprim domain-containing protein [Deltaproteobacteria bacterium]|nr:toprim domain-containing protein [Deltaproteobacteria bacterium]